MFAVQSAQCLRDLRDAASETCTQRQTDRASSAFRDYLVEIKWPSLTAEQRIQALAALLANAPLTAPVRHALGIPTGSRMMQSLTVRYELPHDLQPLWKILLEVDESARDEQVLTAEANALADPLEKARTGRSKLSAAKRRRPDLLPGLREGYLSSAVGVRGEASKVVRVFNQLAEQGRPIRSELLKERTPPTDCLYVN